MLTILKDKPDFFFDEASKGIHTSRIQIFSQDVEDQVTTSEYWLSQFSGLIKLLLQLIPPFGFHPLKNCLVKERQYHPKKASKLRRYFTCNFSSGWEFILAPLALTFTSRLDSPIMSEVILSTSSVNNLTLSISCCWLTSLSWDNISLPTSSLFFVLSFSNCWCFLCVSILAHACFRRFFLASSKLVDLDFFDGSESQFSLTVIISNSREFSGK